MVALRTLPVRCVAAYLRRSPCDAARWRLARYSVKAVRNHGPSMGHAVVRTRLGFRMDLQLHDWLDQHVYATGNYEDSTAATIAALLGEGDACIDIGANVGFFTLLMAGCVGPKGAVWAFEPCPPTRARLLRNVALNRMRNVTVRPEAVSDQDGEAVLFGGSERHSGIASLRPRDSASSYTVRTCRLVTCLPDSIRPSLIKLDVEGAEHLALAGMMDVLASGQPDIVLEMSDHFLAQSGSSSAEIHASLRALGYRMYQIAWNGLVPLHEWDAALPVQFNALCTARPSLPAALTVLPALRPDRTD